MTAARDAERSTSESQLERIERLWGLTSHEAAELFGVSERTYATWRSRGVPASRLTDVADVDAATGTLVRYVREDRIAVVVRRAAEALDGETLLEVARRDPERLQDVVPTMLDVHRVQP